MVIKAVNSAKGVNVQILRFLSLKKCLSKLENVLLTTVPQTMKLYFKNFRKIYNQYPFETASATYECPTSVSGDEIVEYLKSQNYAEGGIFSFSKIIKNSIIYCSSQKETLKCNYSFAKLKNGQFVQIVLFCIGKFDGAEFIIYKDIELLANETDIISTRNSSVRKIVVANFLKSFAITELKNLCIMIAVSDDKYLSELPYVFSNNS